MIKLIMVIISIIYDMALTQDPPLTFRSDILKPQTAALLTFFCQYRDLEL